ncbi:MAG: DivIVA domain-containing protein [Desulfurivibrionaceae bacterium]|nr:DivIVA domain-containing protein [Desulfurivibrionaceae bacterium]
MKEIMTMPLTPENIQNQQFHVRFRGFDVDEVDAFLEKVAENYLVLVKKNEQLTDEMTAVQGERDQIQAQERSFKNAIIAAQNIADEMQAKARQEADLLMENARLEAAALVDEAKELEQSLKKQIASLLLEKQQIKEELQGFLTSHLDRLESQYPDASAPQTGKEAFASEARHDSSQKEEAESRAITEEDDLTALYEKIDLSELGEEDLAEQPADSTESKDSAPEKKATQFVMDEGDDFGPTMPDLDGDMLFRLEDPLDHQAGPEIPIEPPGEEKKSS